MRLKTNVTIICLICLTGFMAFAGEEISNKDLKTVDETYFDLATGVLKKAKLGDLPKDVLVTCDSIEIRNSDLEKIISESQEPIKAQIKKNAFFIIEQETTRKVLLQLAVKEQPKPDAKDGKKDENKQIQSYLLKIAEKAEVSDEDTKKFYDNNLPMFSGAKFEQAKEQIRQYLLQEKQQNIVNEYIRMLGKSIDIKVSSAWAKEQSVIAKDNPVDKARGSGIPSMVDFGADGCGPCDMMTPILKELKEEYDGKLNVLFVHVREEQILGARFGIGTIPTQVFYDKNGKEVFRHTGFFPKDEIEKKFAELGMK
jgi:thiol-disulfide isomerase/thioredoxin